MSLELFTISDKNPNDTVGGKGCMCSPETEPTGREGPFVIFPASCTDVGSSPHAVVCAGCIKAANKKLILANHSESEVLSAGED